MMRYVLFNTFLGFQKEPEVKGFYLHIIIKQKIFRKGLHESFRKNRTLAFTLYI